MRYYLIINAIAFLASILGFLSSLWFCITLINSTSFLKIEEKLVPVLIVTSLLFFLELSIIRVGYHHYKKGNLERAKKFFAISSWIFYLALAAVIMMVSPMIFTSLYK